MENNNNDTESLMNNENIINRTFFSKYKCVKKLGEGSFGMIYKAEYNNEYFALKFENRKKSQNLLESEAEIMSYLKGPNIPYVKSYGYSGDYNILVMQLLGKSLQDIFEERKKFSVKTVCLLACQMLTVLEYIHNHHIIHRDIKPDNFVMGLDDLSQYLYLLDFGLAKKYRSRTTLIQDPMVNKKKLTGTARYASINALRGYEQSRRDDLESVGYVLIYLMKGILPWQGLQAKTKEDRYKRILEQKVNTTSYDLCYGFPNEFERYVEYTKGLEYTEEPDYEMCRGLFMRVLRREKWKFDYIYDWTTKEEIKARKELTLKTDVESHHLKKSPSSRKVRKNSSYKEEENEEYSSKGNERMQSNKEIIYKTTQTENVHAVIDGEEGDEEKKEQKRCCIVF